MGFVGIGWARVGTVRLIELIYAESSSASAAPAISTAHSADGAAGPGPAPATSTASRNGARNSLFCKPSTSFGSSGGSSGDSR